MNKIKVDTVVESNLDKVWEFWTDPKHIIKWAFASDDWEAPHAENDVRTGGRFLTRMAAKDGSQSFDFGGIYTEVVPKEKVTYKMDDGREVVVTFEKETEDKIKITEEFDPENENTEELQRNGWQSILNNFKKYIERESN